MIPIAFFNNKGGVGKTSLLYHLAWAYADMGVRVLMLDLDPQANLSALCLSEDRLEELWQDDGEGRSSIYGAIYPVKEELGDIQTPQIEELSPRLALVPGDLLLASFEAKLSQVWSEALDRRGPAFRALSSFYRVALSAAQTWCAELALIDVGPNLGALNRAALIAAEHLVVPLGADLFSIQALRNLGPTIRQWRNEWKERAERSPLGDLPLPSGKMDPMGYVVMQPNLYGGSVTKAYEKWLRRIPSEWAANVLEVKSSRRSVTADPASLGILKHYRSLMPLAHEARKPIFHLRAADGALGAHATLARSAGDDFKKIARRVAQRVGFSLAK
jgi:cellulose biosynthesis protein BcsQ